MEVSGKRLELHARSASAATGLFATVVNPTNPMPAPRAAKPPGCGAEPSGVRLHVLRQRPRSEFEIGLRDVVRARAGGLVMSPDGSLHRSAAESSAALAVRHAVPAITQSRDFARAGGADELRRQSAPIGYRLVGVYTGRILKGEKPADLAGAAGRRKAELVREPEGGRGRSASPSRSRCSAGADVVIE